MKKPKQKRMIGVRWSWHTHYQSNKSRNIGFDTNSSALVKQLGEFGCVTTYTDCYSLAVSTLYDREEVLEYIMSLDKDKPEKKEHTTQCDLYPCFTCTRKGVCPYVYHSKLKMQQRYQFNRCPFYLKKSTG